MGVLMCIDMYKMLRLRAAYFQSGSPPPASRLHSRHALEQAGALRRGRGRRWHLISWINYAAFILQYAFLLLPLPPSPCCLCLCCCRRRCRLTRIAGGRLVVVIENGVLERELDQIQPLSTQAETFPCVLPRTPHR